MGLGGLVGLWKRLSVQGWGGQGAKNNLVIRVGK